MVSEPATGAYPNVSSSTTSIQIFRCNVYLHYFPVSLALKLCHFIDTSSVH